MASEDITSLRTNPSDYMYVNRRTGKVFTPKELTYMSSQKSPTRAVVLNILWPGLGFVYLGYARYIFLMLFWALLVVAWYAFLASATIELCGMAPWSVVLLLAVGSLFWTLVSSLWIGRRARRLNAGYPYSVAPLRWLVAVRRDEAGEAVSGDRPAR